MKTYTVTPVNAQGTALDPNSPYGKLFNSGRLLYMWEDHIGIGVVQTKTPIKPQKGDTITKNGVAFTVVEDTKVRVGRMHEVYVKRMEKAKMEKQSKQVISVTMGRCGNIPEENLETREQLLKEKRVMFLAKKICGAAVGIGMAQTKKPTKPQLGDIIVYENENYEVEDVCDSFDMPTVYLRETKKT
jgi:hypothetical protein